MISLDQYVGPHFNSPDWTPERKKNAIELLSRVSLLMSDAIKGGVVFEENPHTHSNVAGVTFGGFRPQDCPQGAPGSSHKTGEGIDIYDPYDALDNWITSNPHVLEDWNLYREHPDSTHHWCHLTTRAPRSGRRTFLP